MSVGEGRPRGEVRPPCQAGIRPTLKRPFDPITARRPPANPVNEEHVSAKGVLRAGQSRSVDLKIKSSD